MQIASLPDNESKRLAALARYDILDTTPEEEFDDITRLASYICNTPIATMTLVDATRQWFKSRVGLDAPETPREIAFCAHTILSADTIVVRDALEDERFADNPLVTSNPHIRFYAGVPLITPDGYALGSLCAIDRVPRNLSDAQLDALQVLARQVVRAMELRQSHRQLNQLSKKLTHVNDGKDRLFSMIAHDLKSPVGGVLGLLEVMAEDVKGMEMAEIQRYLNMLASSTRGTFDLLESLLQWSVQESGKMDYKPVALSLDDMVSQVFTFTALAAHHKSITLVAPTKSCQLVMADRNMLRSVLQNLVANAIKFTPAGGHVAVSCEDRDKWVGVSVKDSGNGMTAERLHSALELDDMHSSLGTGGEVGTGLGLKFCRAFIECHGGKLTATSIVGAGTIFTFTLPAA